jgi:hypothetical protein
MLEGPVEVSNFRVLHHEFHFANAKFALRRAI